MFVFVRGVDGYQRGSAGCEAGEENPRGRAVEREQQEFRQTCAVEQQWRILGSS